MGLLEKIVGGNIGELFQKIVGTFKLSPEKAAELSSLAEQHATELKKVELEMEARIQEAYTREIEAASANIKAEAMTGDKYTSRARPTFMYLVYVIFLFNYVILPALNRPPVTYPEALFWLFGAGYLGYTGSREWGKMNVLRFFGGNGNGNGKSNGNGK